MSFYAPVLRVMLCSPGDTSLERAALEKAVYEWTSDNLYKEEIVLIPVGWESLPPLSNGKSGQVRINEAITSKADIFIGVFKHRFGAKGTNDEVATVEEIMLGMSRLKPVHLYFYDGEEAINTRDSNQVSQLSQVHAFKSKMQDEGLYDRYETIDGLVTLLGKALNLDTYEFMKHSKEEVASSIASSMSASIASGSLSGSIGTDVSRTVTIGNLDSKSSTAKTTRSGLPYPTRPVPSDDSVSSDNSPITKKGLPTRPQRPVQGEASSDQKEKQRQKKLDYERMSKKFVDDRSDLTLRDLQSPTEREEEPQRQRIQEFQRSGEKFVDDHERLTSMEIQDLDNRERRSNRRAIDENDNWVSMKIGDELPTLDDLKRYKKNPPSLSEQEQLESDRRKHDLENAESVAQWNSGLPLERVDSRTYRLSSGLTPVLSLMHGELRVKFTGESGYLIENLNISIRDIMGKNLDFGFIPGELGGFQAGQTLSFPLDLSKTGSMHNTVDISWTVKGQEFSTSKNMILR